MNCKNYKTNKSASNHATTLSSNDDVINNNYFLSIIDNDTHITEEMYLSEKEFKILNIAVQHNRGIINLLSNVEIIHGLFRKGLITISDDELEVAVVSDIIAYLLNPKTTEDFSENPFLEENRPNGFFKIFGNKSICFCCL